MSDFLKHHFDKLLLVGIFLGLLAFELHAVHHGVDDGFLTGIERSADQILAALLTLMVGQRLTQRKEDDPPK